jgi:thiamine-phosphate pyrophosphorylase
MNYRLSGLYAITDKNLISREYFEVTVEKAIQGGVRMLQLREKDTVREEALRLGKIILKITKSYGVPLIINDSPELARDIGADGVHLGENDCSIEHARSVLGRDAIIGVSCYGQIERGLKAQMEGADYVAFGTPYFTPTKPDRSPTPLEVLRDARVAITKIPIFAIGGITSENASLIMETGVEGIAVITSIFGSEDPEEAARELASIIK